MAASGVFTGITGWWVARNQVPLAFLDLAGFPEMSGVAARRRGRLAGALCSPPPAVPYAAVRPLRQEAAA